MKKSRKNLTPEQILEVSARETAKDRTLVLAQIDAQKRHEKIVRPVLLGLASLFRDLERIDVRGASRLR